MPRLTLFLFFILGQALTSLGQQKLIDSLIVVLDRTPDQKKQVDLLNELSSLCYDFLADKGLEYAKRANALATEIRYLDGIRYATTLEGYYYVSTSTYDSALLFYNRSASLARKEDEILGYNHILTGNLFRLTDQYDSAQKHYTQAIELLKRINSKRQLAHAYKNVGRFYLTQFKNSNAEEAFNKALTLYKELGKEEQVADTWFSLADVYRNEANYAKVNMLVNDGCEVAERRDNEFLKLSCMIQQGKINFSAGEYSTALTYLFDALSIVETQRTPSLLEEVYSEIGRVYDEMGQDDVALKYFLQALKISERIGIKHETAKLNNNIAWVYKNLYDFRLAHQFMDRSIEIRKELNDQHGLSGCYNILGLIYFREKKFLQAISMLEEALRIRKAINYTEGISTTLSNLAIVFEAQDNYRKSLDYQLEALVIEEQIGNRYNLGISYHIIASNYSKLKMFDKARPYLERAATLGKEIKSRTLMMNSHYYWSEYYELKGDFKNSLKEKNLYIGIKDSIFHERSVGKLAELQALYQLEKKDQEILLLNQQNELHANQIQLQQSRINTQNIVIIGIAFLFVLIAIFGYKTYQYTRQIRKAHREIYEQKEEIQSQSEELIDANQTIAEINRKLEEKIVQRTQALTQAYKELDTFFYRSSHDFRRPLTTFMGLAEVAKITVKDQNALELFSKVRETASNLDKMLVKLQSISDVGSQQLLYKEVLIKEIFETVCDSLRDEMQRKNIMTLCDVKIHSKFLSYPAMVKIMIENLVENAVFFSGVDQPYIKLKAVQIGDSLTIEIEDNGQGIPEEYQRQVFDMYFRANERSKGNGLGLYIVKKAVEKLDGTIAFESALGKGSTFTIILPMAQHIS
jgi:signal transduction histidine kinase